MKICMLGFTHFEFDGRLHRYSLSLVERGDQVDMIGLGDPGEPRVVDFKGVRLYHLDSRDFKEAGPVSYLWNYFYFFMKAFWCVTGLHIRNRYDVIHYHNIPDFGVFCTLIPKMMGARVILDIHDLVPEFYMRKFHVHPRHPVIRALIAVEKASARFADHVITVTELWRRRLAERSVPPGKCTVILNVPIRSVFKPRTQAGKKSAGKLVSYHGNLAEPTGVDLLIRAMEKIKKDIPDIRLQIIGGGRDSDSLKAYVRSHALERWVRFIPARPLEELPAWVYPASLCVDPKREGVYAGETLSVKVMEYLGMGKAALVSRTRAASLYFDEDVVRFFKPGDVDDLAFQIRKLIRSPGTIRRLEKNTGRFFAEHDWKGYCAKYFSLLDRLTERESGKT
ncbi:glycosyltransferase family 4 protein [bacterium]|nr:glycosyltransferase family 4 protein [bacterium]